MKNERLEVELFGYGVVSAAAPRMATKNAFDCQIETFERSVALNSLYCITAAGGGETARGRCQGRYTRTVEVYGKQEQ